jgi:beta-glucosidase
VYNHKPTGRGDDYLDLTGQPLFPFGYGLSYTTFEYSDLVIGRPSMGVTDSTTVRCTVRNTGTKAGDEVVQLYLHDELASVARPVTELKGFARVRLQPGEARDVEFAITPAMLSVLDRDLVSVVEPGDVRVMIGASSKDIRLRGYLTLVP